MVLSMDYDGFAFPDFGDYSLVITWDGTEPREPLRLFVAPLPVPRAIHGIAGLICSPDRDAQVTGADCTPADGRARH